MTQLLQIDTYHSRWFLVLHGTHLGGSRLVYRGKDWNEARKADHEVTGEWALEPTGDAAEILDILNQADRQIAEDEGAGAGPVQVEVIKAYDNPLYPDREDDR